MKDNRNWSMSTAHFHLLARDDGESLSFPIWGSQHQPSAATHSAAFIIELSQNSAGPQVGLAHVLALGSEEHPYLPHSIPAPLCCAPRNSCDLRMKRLFLMAEKVHILSLSSYTK